MPRSYGVTNAAPYPTASAPAAGAPAGDTYYNTTTKTFYISDGTTWNPISGGGSTDLADGGTKSAAFTAVINTRYLLNCPSSTVITLPTAPVAGSRVAFARIDNNFISGVSETVTAGGTDTIQGGVGVTTFLMGGQYSRVELVYYSGIWYVSGYGIQGLGSPLGINQVAVGNGFAPSLMLRDGSGRSQVSDPAADQDAASKIYVDGAINSIAGPASVTLSNRDSALVDCTGGNVTITLPNTARNYYKVKRLDASANTLTVVASAGTIDGDPNATFIGQWSSAIFMGTGTHIRILSSYGALNSNTLTGPVTINGSLAVNPGNNLTVGSGIAGQAYTSHRTWAQSFVTGTPPKQITTLVNANIVHEDRDYGAGWNAGVFTIPVTGYWDFTLFTFTVPAATRTLSQIQQNGNSIAWNETPVATPVSANVTAVWCVAGDLITFWTMQISGATVAMSGYATASRRLT